MRHRDPPPCGGGQSSMALPVEQKRFTPDRGCRHNHERGVNLVTISRAITHDLALPVPFGLGSEVQISHSVGACLGRSRALHPRLLRTFGSGNCGIEYPGGPCSPAGVGSAEGIHFRVHGDNQGPDSNPGSEQVPSSETKTLLGQSFLGAGLLC